MRFQKIMAKRAEFKRGRTNTMRIAGSNLPSVQEEEDERPPALLNVPNQDSYASEDANSTASCTTTKSNRTNHE